MNIYKHILLVFLLLITKLSNAETISGYVKSETGEGVPFASIFLQEKNIGLVTDINGHYRLPINILSEIDDTLVFSSVGYTTKRIPIGLFAEKAQAGHTTIVLAVNSISLPEVVITSNLHGPRDYGFSHLRASPFFLPLRPSERVMVFVENTDGKPKIIQTINIRITSGITTGIEKFRVFFYQRTEIGFQNINVSDEGIFITDFPQGDIRHDVSKHRIPFPMEGIYVGIEWIGAENVIQDRSRPSERMGVSTTTRGRHLHSWIFFREKWEAFPPKDIKEAVVNYLPRRHRRLALRLINSNFQIGITAY